MLLLERECAESLELVEIECVRTGTLRDAAVEGLRSWCGEGARLREADWRVEARVMAGSDAMFLYGGGELDGWFSNGR